MSCYTPTALRASWDWMGKCYPLDNNARSPQPLNLGCCAFAGDRGLLHPELTASATEKETAEVLLHNYSGYYSSNITCEMGMSEATGKDYVGIAYLVERASRPT